VKPTAPLLSHHKHKERFRWKALPTGHGESNSRPGICAPGTRAIERNNLRQDRAKQRLLPNARSNSDFLAEVCFGFEVPDFERVIGCTPPFARQLFNRLDGLDLDDNNVVTIQINELRAIRNAHIETLRVLGAEEYQTRTGVPFIEGERIARELDDLLDRLPGH
jgi:hypothetical protein